MTWQLESKTSDCSSIETESLGERTCILEPYCLLVPESATCCDPAPPVSFQSVALSPGPVLLLLWYQMMLTVPTTAATAATTPTAIPAFNEDPSSQPRSTITGLRP